MSRLSDPFKENYLCPSSLINNLGSVPQVHLLFTGRNDVSVILEEFGEL